MNIVYVHDEDTRRAFLTWRPAYNDWVACDVETSGLNPWKDQLRLVQLGTMDEAWVLPYPQERGAIEEFLSHGRPLVGHNSKFDAQFLRNAGLPYRGLVDDTKIMAHLLNSVRSLHLKDLVQTVLGESVDDQRLLFDVFKKNKWTWGTVPQDTFEYWYYGGMDTIRTARLARWLVTELQFNPTLMDLYEMEVDVWLAIADAEHHGFRLDVDYAYDVLLDLEKQILAIVERYPTLNLGSNRQLAEKLAADGFHVGRTPKGNPRLTAADLETLRDHSELARDVLQFRGLSKLASTYFGGFLDMQVDGYVHPNIKTLGARTGRMSCAEPNLQNVPKREAGAFVRRSFLASPGHTLILADYAQIEYRIFASYAREKDMIQAFLDGKDMHAVTAEMALGHAPDAHERLIAKNGNFAELYGAGTKKFAATAGISVEQAASFKKRYHQTFTNVKPFTRAVVTAAERNGWRIETEFGRSIPVDKDKVYGAVNYMIQGSAADVLKRAIVKVADSEWGQYFVLPIHDELIFDVPNDRVADCVEALPGLMEDHTSFTVPLVVEVTTQHRWGEEEE